VYDIDAGVPVFVATSVYPNYEVACSDTFIFVRRLAVRSKAKRRIFEIEVLSFRVAKRKKAQLEGGMHG
jgi:hypothetical protein